MAYLAQPQRPQDSDSCGRCGLPADVHATTAGAAACAIARALEQLRADGWNLPAPTEKGHTRR